MRTDREKFVVVFTYYKTFFKQVLENLIIYMYILTLNQSNNQYINRHGT